jgi:hypothetical protein
MTPQIQIVVLLFVVGRRCRGPRRMAEDAAGHSPVVTGVLLALNRAAEAASRAADGATRAAGAARDIALAIRDYLKPPRDEPAK